MKMIVSTPTRTTYWELVTSGTSAASTTKPASQAALGTRPTARPKRVSSSRSSWRSTHSSVPMLGRRDSSGGVGRSVTSHLLERPRAEQPRRAHEHEHDQDREHDQVLVYGRDVPRAVGLREPDQDAAEHRAGYRADAADDGRGEALQACVEAHEVVDLREEQAAHHAGRSRQRRADEEGRDDHAVDVDPHHRGGLAVEGRRAHRLPELRTPDEDRQ